MEKPEAVVAKLNKELSAHRLAGPFSDPPFEKFLVSPLGVVPKKIPEEYRLIHHLSFPKGHPLTTVYRLRTLQFSMLPFRMPLHLSKQLEKIVFLQELALRMHSE